MTYRDGRAPDQARDQGGRTRLDLALAVVFSVQAAVSAAFGGWVIGEHPLLGVFALVVALGHVALGLYLWSRRGGW